MDDFALIVRGRMLEVVTRSARLNRILMDLVLAVALRDPSLRPVAAPDGVHHAPLSALDDMSDRLSEEDRGKDVAAALREVVREARATNLDGLDLWVFAPLFEGQPGDSLSPEHVDTPEMLAVARERANHVKIALITWFADMGVSEEVSAYTVNVLTPRVSARLDHAHRTAVALIEVAELLGGPDA